MSPTSPSSACVALVVIDQAPVLRAAIGEREARSVVESAVEAVRRAVTASTIVVADEGLRVWFPVVDDVAADVFVAAARDAVRQPVEVRGRPLRVTASIGYDVVEMPIDGLPDESVVARAAAAAHAASRAGGNRCVRAGDASTPDPGATVRLWGELRAAIQYRQLEVWFQPIVSLATGRPVGAEALTRWHHPRFGDVSPLEFITSAEQNSEIHGIGAFVQDRVIQVARALRTDSRLRLGDFQLAMNVGFEELTSPSYATALTSRLAADDVRPGWLSLEIPDRVGGSTDPTLCDNLAMLAASGVTITVSDVGVAVSHLPDLVDLGVRRVRLDRRSVTAIDTDDRVRTVARALVSLADELGLDTVATGVERPEQASVLSALGCRAAQGFLYAPAVPETELAAVLADLSDRTV